MTTRPTLEANKGTGSVLTSAEWNTNVLQQGNWTQEVILGTNSDKIVGASLSSSLALPGKVTFAASSLAAGDVGICYNAGNQMQFGIPTGATGWQWTNNAAQVAALTYLGALTLSSTLSTTGIVSSGAWPSGQTLTTSGSPTLSGNGGSGITPSFVAGGPGAYGYWTVNLNGTTSYIPFYR